MEDSERIARKRKRKAQKRKKSKSPWDDALRHRVPGSFENGKRR